MAAAAAVAPDLSVDGGYRPLLHTQQGLVAAGTTETGVGPQQAKADHPSQQEQQAMKASSAAPLAAGEQVQAPTNPHEPTDTPTPLKLVAPSPPPVSANNNRGSNPPGTPQMWNAPLTLDDIWPAVLTSSHRTSSACSEDALMDLYNQFLRNGSGSFHSAKRQDSILSGSVGGTLNRSGGSFTLLQSPKVLATLQSLANTPKGFASGFNYMSKGLTQGSGAASRGLDATPRGLGVSSTPRGVSNTPRGLLGLESLASPGATGGSSPGLVSLLSGPFRTVSLEKGGGISHDWLSWPPLAGTRTAEMPPPASGQSQQQEQQGSAAQPAVSHDQQQQQQQQLDLQAAPSVQGWLAVESSAVAAAGPTEPEDLRLEQQQAVLDRSAAMAVHGAPIVMQPSIEGPLTLQHLDHTGMLHLSRSSNMVPGAAGTYTPLAEVPVQADFRMALLPPGPPAAAAGDCESPSDEPEQHPYTTLDPAAAAAAAAAARQQRKQLLAELRSKRPQPARKRRIVRRQTLPFSAQAASSLMPYRHIPPGPPDVLSPEERRSLTKAARAALLARQRGQQHLTEQQQQAIAAAAAAAGAGSTGMPAGLLRQGPLTFQTGQMLYRSGQMQPAYGMYNGPLGQPHAAAAAGGAAGMGVPMAAAIAADAELASSDPSSSDSSDDDSSDLSSDYSDHDADLEAAAAAARAGSANMPPCQGLSDCHYQQLQLQQLQQQQQSRGSYSGMMSAHMDLSHQQQQMPNGRRVSSPGMPPLFVRVAATGRHGSGTSDTTAVDHSWTTGAAAAGLNLGHGAISSGRRSAASSIHNSPDQPLQRQQQHVVVKDGCSRVVIDPHTSKITVYPRTKRGRRLTQTADADRTVVAADEQAKLVRRGTVKVQQQQGDAAHERGRNAAVVGPAAEVPSQQQAAGTLNRSQSEQLQQPEGLVRSSSIAVSRPRRKIKPTAAAVAYLADSDNEAEGSVKYDRMATAADVAAAAAARSAAAADQASDQDSESDLGDQGESSNDEISSDFEEYDPVRGNGRKSRARRQSSSAAVAAATKRRRSSGAGSPDDPGPQAAAAGSRRRAKRGGSSKRSDQDSGAAAAAPKPLVEDTRSKYRGVTRHRRSGRWEAHIWVKELGRQVYLGGYEPEEAAAEAYDMAALKCKGRSCATNFPSERYADLLDSLDSMTLEELIMAVRRQSQGFSRGSSNYRGVTAHPSGRWESRIGIPGSRHVYLGLFSDEQEAARAYDGALVRLKGTAAATNYSLGCYQQQLAEHYQMRMAVEAGLVHKELFRRHSGQDFEQWIKQGLSAFDIEMTAEARDMARADTGNAAEGAAADGAAVPAVIRLGSGRVSGDGGGSKNGSPVVC